MSLNFTKFFTPHTAQLHNKVVCVCAIQSRVNLFLRTNPVKDCNNYRSVWSSLWTSIIAHFSQFPRMMAKKNRKRSRACFTACGWNKVDLRHHDLITSYLQVEKMSLFATLPLNIEWNWRRQRTTLDLQKHNFWNLRCMMHFMMLLATCPLRAEYPVGLLWRCVMGRLLADLRRCHIKASPRWGMHLPKSDALGNPRLGRQQSIRSEKLQYSRWKNWTNFRKSDHICPFRPISDSLSTNIRQYQTPSSSVDTGRYW